MQLLSTGISRVSPSRGSAALGASLRQGLLLALIATALIFALHHLPPLDGHALLTVVGVVAGATLVASLAAHALPRRGVRSPVVVVTSGEAEVGPMRQDDLEFSARLHEEALGHGFFVSLGQGFLRAYHRTFLDSPHAVAFTSTLDGHRVGFLIGVLEPVAHARWVFRHRGAGLALRGAGALLVRPLVAVRFARSRVRRYAAAWRRHRGRGPESGREQGADAPSAVLSHVAVAPGARGTGAGRRLVRTFEASARAAGARTVILTTLAGPEGAGQFYAGLGWTHRGNEGSFDGQPTERWSQVLRGAE